MIINCVVIDDQVIEDKESIANYGKRILLLHSKDIGGRKIYV